jgi:hypothetical protein
MIAIVNRVSLAVRRVNARCLGLVLAVGASLSISACSVLGANPESWIEGDVNIASERLLRQIATIAMEKNGLPPGTEEGNLQSTVSSGWKVQLQPFKGDGTRAKAHMQYEEKSTSVWHVYIRVQKDTNEELARPLDLTQAQWASGPDDDAWATRILKTMQAMLGTEFHLSPEMAPPVAKPSDS